MCDFGVGVGEKVDFVVGEFDVMCVLDIIVGLVKVFGVIVG